MSVHESAVRSSSSVLLLGSILLFLKKPMLLTANCTVLVALVVLPFFVQSFGFVYSPTLSKKKKAIVDRSPTACSLGSVVLYPASWHSSAISTGIAIYGVEGGSSLL